MRKLVLVAALAGAASILSACSQGADDAAGTAQQSAPADAAANATGDANAEAATATTTVLDANTAATEQLTAAKGVTPELAAAIVSGRPYADVTALNAKLRQTMTQDQAAAVLANVFVPINLNTASEEAIQLIPGMTPKMVREFLEYRPYADMAEFDREIGKYVDEAEVARFRNYVTL